MGKIISIIGGTVAMVLGLILMLAWKKAFILGIEFLVIFILVLGGLIAVIAGVSEIKDSLAAKKEEAKEKTKEDSGQ